MGEGLKRARAAAKATWRKVPSIESGVTTLWEKQFKIAGGAIIVGLSPDCVLDPTGVDHAEEWVWRVHKKDRHPAHDPSGALGSFVHSFDAAVSYWQRHGFSQTTPPTQWDAP